MFDQAVAIREKTFEMSEAMGEVEFAIARDGFVEVNDQAWADGDVFDVHDGGIRSEAAEDLVQAIVALVYLAEGFEVVDVVHDQANVWGSDFVDHAAAGIGVLQDRDDVGFHDCDDTVHFQCWNDSLQGLDQEVPGFGSVIVTVRGPAALRVQAAGADQVMLGR